MKKTACIVMFLIALLSSGSSAGEVQGEPGKAGASIEETAQEEVYTFPEIKPEVRLSGGYRIVDRSGSARAGEFEYLNDTITLGGEARIFSFPHRFHLELEVKGPNDYFADLSYSYKDLVVFRGINRTLWHNLENITLIDLNTATTPATSPSGPAVDIRDRDVRYGVRTGMSSAFLRFKTPDFPFHLYIDGSLLTRDGTQQQRSMQGSAYFNNNVRTSQTRDVDWRVTQVVVGANSHLGPFEIDLSHGEKRFDANGDKVFFDTYASATSGSTVVLNSGTYPHNQIPESKGSSNTLKLHTSYTGSLVASATLSKVERTNEESGAKADYVFGSGEVVWMPVPRLAFFLKYRHKETDEATPETISYYNVCSPSNNATGTYKCYIKPAINTVTDSLTGTVRYRLAPGATLKAEYSYEDIRRTHAEEWFRPDSTERHTASVSADLRVIRGMNVNLKYTHRDITDPAYNTEPNSSDEGRLSVSWVPLPWLNALLSYRIAKEDMDHLAFVHQDPVLQEEVLVEGPTGRQVDRHRFLGSATVLLRHDLSLTASYSYMRDKAVEDLAYHNTSGDHLFDAGVPYSDQANTYTLDLSYTPEKRCTLSAGVSHTISSGFFAVASTDLTTPVSVASFSGMKVRETTYSFSGEYRLRGGFSAGLQYHYTVLNDVLENPNDDVEDGKVHIVYLTLTKRW